MTPLPTDDYDVSVLLLSVPTLSHLRSPSYLGSAISSATSNTQSRLLILVFSPLFDDLDHGGLVPTHSWKDVQRLLTYIYVEATRVTQAKGNILMAIDVVLHPTEPERLLPEVHSVDSVNWKAVYVLDVASIIPYESLPIATLPTTLFTPTLDDDTNLTVEPSPSIQSPEIDVDTSNYPPLYPVAALGGTFDHLHAGHKILLSIGAWIASEKLIIGVTDAALLVKKSNAAVLESMTERMDGVRQFCKLFKPTIEYDVVSISDVYGPTGWDPNIQALVLSRETMDGASAIAKHRAEKSLPPLEPFVIDVISSTSANVRSEGMEELRSAKLSSTFIRQWIVDKGEAGDVLPKP